MDSSCKYIEKHSRGIDKEWLSGLNSDREQTLPTIKTNFLLNVYKAVTTNFMGSLAVQLHRDIVSHHHKTIPIKSFITKIFANLMTNSQH